MWSILRLPSVQPPASHIPMRRIELIPGKLTTTVQPHTIHSREGPISCWSYFTDGLLAHRQQELILTVKRKEDEEDDGFPDDPLHFFKRLYDLTQQGKTIDGGDYTRFGRPGFLDHDGVVGLVYVRANERAAVGADTPL